MTEAVSTFTPATGMKNAHLQTLYAPLTRRNPQPSFRIETFRFDDGDFTDCCWYREPAPGEPLVVLFHGLQGSYRSPYIRGIADALVQRGCGAVLMHFRGCSGRPNALPRSYHSGDTADARAYLTALRRRHPDNPLYAVGYSLGANMLLKLLGEDGESCILDGAVAVSAPMRLALAADRIDRGFSRFYQARLLRELKAALLEKYTRFDMRSLLGIGPEDVRALRNFRAFDDAYTAPVHGFASAEDYYRRCSAVSFLPAIRIPTLILHSLDDPFMTPGVLPGHDTLPTAVTMEVSAHGGHVGFVSGSPLRPHYWLESRIPRFFDALRRPVL
jgi:predicted alpha/beta-fold hydrolase